MKNHTKLNGFAAFFSFIALPCIAQQIYPDSIKDAYDKDTDQQAYSQAQSLTSRLPIELMAVNEPAQFEGLLVTNNEGAEIGKVLSIARRKTDQSLQAIITSSTGNPVALPLDVLSVSGLAYWAPASALNNEHFEEADFEPVSQYQTGHSALGSLTNPDDEPTADTSERDEADNEADLENTADLAERAVAANNPANAANPVYEPVGSAVVQLAITNPDAFTQKTLIDEAGNVLGQIDYIARNLQDQKLYAVVSPSAGAAQTAVSLDALTIGSLAVEPGHSGAVTEEFNEADFETVRSR
ncbi:MAG: hypothetical protein V4628_00230 [Pseudomonadota bacterium]